MISNEKLHAEVQLRLRDKHTYRRIDKYMKRGGWKKASVKAFTKRTVRKKKSRDTNGKLLKFPNGKQKWKRICRLRRVPLTDEVDVNTPFINSRSHTVYMSTVKRISNLSRSGDLKTYSGKPFTLATMTPEDIDGVYNKPFAPDSAFHGEGQFPALDLSGTKTTKERKDARYTQHKNATRPGHRLFSTTLKRIYICREMIKADNACCRTAFVATATVVGVIATATVVGSVCTIV
uniref:Uncharacterized protein n=1 Tax=viral metagenome TaxID=1070528 RepID=A0A6C0B3I3_9ZZZZ